MSEMLMEQRGEVKPPVHIHLTDETPVHVHVKKPRRPNSAVNFPDDDRYGGSGNARRVGPSGRGVGRSRSPGSRPMRPGLAPAKRSTTAGLKYTAQQGSSNRMTTNGPTSRDLTSPSHKDRDLESDEDEGQVLNKVGNYEEKLDGLKSEVGSLKTEVERQKAMRAIEKRNELLETSCRALEEQRKELEEYKQELAATDAVNRKLRRDMDSLNRSTDDRSASPVRSGGGGDKLARKLMEAELEGQAIGKQASALVDTVRLLKEDKRLAPADCAMLMKQKELLEDRLSRFTSNSSGLRTLLTYREDQEVVMSRLAEQRDRLLARLAQTQDTNQELMTQLLQKEHENDDLKLQLDAQREETLSVSSLQSSLAVTKAHLQKQLKQKDADCNRLAVQIRTLESQLAQERIDIDHLRGLLAQVKSKPDRDKEALKKATRVQKLRAVRSEDALEEMKLCVMERDSALEELRSELNTLRSQHHKQSREKAQALAELSAVKLRLCELEGVMDSHEDDSRAVTSRLQEKSGEISAVRLDNDRLRTACASAENRMAQKDHELAELKSNLREYQILVEEYRSQMNNSRREVDDSLNELDAQRRETHRVKQQGEEELEKVKERLQARLVELEPIPELLRATELRLQSAMESVRQYEARTLDNVRQLTELQAKVERQSGQLTETRERGSRALDDSRSLAAKLDVVERKLSLLEDENKELLAMNAKREEALNQTNIRLDEKLADNANLQRQLESTSMDLRRIKEQEREKTASAERALQTRIIELESQLSQTRAEVSRLKREKDEIERKMNSRLYDLKDRLEQSHATNRSMQNYVQFLKNSYSTAFNESTLGPTTSTPQRAQLY